MAQQASESLRRAQRAEGCVVLIFSTKDEFLEHYREVALSLGFVPMTVETPDAAIAILRLMVVAFVVIDQSSGIQATRTILKRVQQDQAHALALVVAQEPDPRFRREALSLGAAEYLDHPAAPEDFVYAF